MHPKRNRSARPKLFQCKGYGECNMVFTRSEHLARHARKHTGEKPFVCIVPECKKAFSRFDNMMQHTQTHRNSHHHSVAHAHSKDGNHKDGPDDQTRSNTRAQNRQPPHANTSTTTASKQQQNRHPTANNSELYTSPSHLVSPVSLSASSPKRRRFSSCSSSSDDEQDGDDDDIVIIQTPSLKRTRRLSVADLCHPTNVPLNTPATSIQNLTKDEVEALEGFGRFRHSPTSFFNPLKDLAQIHNYE